MGQAGTDTDTATGLPPFGALVRRYRQAAALSQAALAQRAGLSTDAISVIERGKRGVPHPHTVALLAQALELSAEERTAFIAAARAVTLPARDPASVRPPSAPLRLSLPLLPVPLTAFIGRAREVTAVRNRLLDPPTRLLTLTGMGGIGKTRLALQVALQVRDAFPDGVVMVDLAPLADPALVVPLIARTLGLTESGSQPLREALHAALRERRLLLLLDNVEHLLEAAGEVSALLTACAHVRVLVTSRAPLRLYGERLYPVPPLSLPVLPSPSVETLLQAEAVRLFIARAQDVAPDFVVTSEAAPHVAAICVQLDGLPLAIELAARRVRLFSLDALLARLAHRLGVLTDGPRDVPVRQRTVRATIDWSYGLLTMSEQTLLARLSVFWGGWTVEAVEAICTGDGALDALSGVASLLEKSLLDRTEGEGEVRFAMLETVREYARGRLEASGEAEALRAAHAAYYLALAEEAEPALKGPQQAAWLGRLERERHNLRAALGWLQETRDDARGLRLAVALGRFWELQGRWSEGRRWLDGLLALPAPGGERATTSALESRVRLAAQTLSAALAALQHDYERARALAEASATLARSTGDVPGLIDALLVLEQEAVYQRWALAEARELATCSVAQARALADPWRTARALHRLAYIVYHDGDYAQAARLWEESVALYRACGDPAERARTLRWLGELVCHRGDLAQGVRHLQDAVALLPQAQVSALRASTLEALAEALSEQGAYGQADALFAQALAIYQTVGAPSMVVRCHINLANMARLQGQDERAEALLAESLQQARAIGARFETAYALWIQGDLLRDRGLYNRAEAVYQESLALFEPMRIPLVSALVLRSLGVLAQRQGRLALAREHLERALPLVQGMERLVHAPILAALGRVAADEGDLAVAERLLVESLGQERAMERPYLVADALEALAEVAVAQSQPRRAVRLAAAAAGIRGSIGAPLSYYGRARAERIQAAACAALGTADFEATWTEAQGAPWDVLVDEALTRP